VGHYIKWLDAPPIKCELCGNKLKDRFIDVDVPSKEHCCICERCSELSSLDIKVKGIYKKYENMFIKE